MTSYLRIMGTLFIISYSHVGVQARESDHNPGVIFDNIVDMSNHIQTVCKSSCRELIHLRSITATLACDALKKVTHAFICSCLDYCNALLYSLPPSSISKLQRIQNGCWQVQQKLTTWTPVLKSIHRFPVENRIDFKVTLLVFCALHYQTQEYIGDILQEWTNVWTLCSPVLSCWEQIQKLWGSWFPRLWIYHWL